MAELNLITEFIAQITPTNRQIQRTGGITQERFAEICSLPGAPQALQRSIAESVSALQSGMSEEINSTAFEDIFNAVIGQLESFTSLEQYVWLVRMVVAAELVRGLPRQSANIRRKLRWKVESIPLDKFSHSPACIHVVTKALVEGVPLEGLNLEHAIDQLSVSLSQLQRYVAVALLFVGLDAILKPQQKTAEPYQMHTVDTFLGYLELLNLRTLSIQLNDLQALYNLLRLLGLYQNMVIMRRYDKDELEREHKQYADYFRVRPEQRNTFWEWLKKSSSLVTCMSTNDPVDKLILADLFEIDMLPLFDDILEEEGVN
ncbi:uncharacterized protein LOC126581570 [Anopheles aquasalis]|uniref:uncharacterized protein LOC126581570 n=1 Tax=Anopheles aquasalis TaxID=42839 RepID=UPI00215A4D40|nr:uncharacterized protein LOC126581570 [Anopheles aquasalis]